MRSHAGAWERVNAAFYSSFSIHTSYFGFFRCDTYSPSPILPPSKSSGIFSISEDLKTKFAAGLREPLLPGRVMALLFEKPSLRTRVSFEAAMAHLGGIVDVPRRRHRLRQSRESLADFGRVLSEYVDVIVIRAKQP